MWMPMNDFTLPELSPREETIAYLKMMARKMQAAIRPTPEAAI